MHGSQIPVPYDISIPAWSQTIALQPNYSHTHFLQLYKVPVKMPFKAYKLKTCD